MDKAKDRGPNPLAFTNLLFYSTTRRSLRNTSTKEGFDRNVTLSTFMLFLLHCCDDFRVSVVFNLRTLLVVGNSPKQSLLAGCKTST